MRWIMVMFKEYDGKQVYMYLIGGLGLGKLEFVR